ncbi:ABC transporter permease [Porphyromonas sp. COT-290 OH3588]|uniref:ABC transporter permease n=1 Tax=Porphyromonas sp. COT-290 OH3588 TaxID=1515617 RepID=UPI00052E3EA4|nr:ABC transporter permease [Porphyromonas sp. COT-290 OH3588]KGN97143.1 hypothetical protein HQ48_09035 [Porphyromonas sp. COT-290 OH3588]
MKRLLDRETLREVGHTLGRNKRRSIVTSFGVFWGIFMLVILLSLSKGLQNGIKEMTSSVAPNMLQIYTSETSLPYSGFGKGRRWDMSPRDIDILRARVPEIKAIGASLQDWGSTIEYEGKKDRQILAGVTPEFFDITLVNLIAGRHLSLQDEREHRKVCIIGKRVATEKMGISATQAVGKSILIGGHYYTIVGVVSAKSENFSMVVPVSHTAFAPLGIVSSLSNRPEEVDLLYVTTHHPEHSKQASEKIKDLIRAEHHIAPTDETAVRIFDTNEIFATFDGINIALGILVWIVGIGTLLTGIIGVSNILLVTVRERTQEIGVRRALGARPRDILRQLMLESSLLTTLSGLLGLVLGVGVMSLVVMATSSLGEGSSDGLRLVNPIISISTALLAVLIIVASGLVAGLLPAIKAIEVKAIEAIREE